MAYVAPEDQVVETEVSVIEVETFIAMKDGKCMMVSIKATDRPGLLATTTGALQKLDAKVRLSVDREFKSNAIHNPTQSNLSTS